MGEEYLYQKWLKENVKNLQSILVSRGVEGILCAFELWLEGNGYLNSFESGGIDGEKTITGKAFVEGV